MEVRHGKRSGVWWGTTLDTLAKTGCPREMGTCITRTWGEGGMHSRQKQTQQPWNVGGLDLQYFLS